MPTEYWLSRCNLRYYRIVRHLLDDLGPGELLIDVGSGDTPVCTFGDFRERIAVDCREREPCHGVHTVQSDWLDYAPPRLATAVTCLQVLEHLSDEVVGAFAMKLLQSAEHVVISVPYQWRKGQCQHHKQDPIDERKLGQIMGRNPLETIIVTERPNRTRARRLVALYQGIGTDDELQGIAPGTIPRT